MTNHFLSFCFDIGRIPANILLRSAQGLINSLNYHKNDYTFTLYTNILQLYDMPLAKQSNIHIIEYDVSTIPNECNGNKWHNLSTFKLSAIATIGTEKGIYPVWMDLDTIVCRNIDHLSDYPNFFVMQGTADTILFNIFPGIGVPNKDYIQGNIWKLSKELVTYFTELWSSFDKKPEYDLQGMYNYAYYFKEQKANMLILGMDLDKDTVNGLDVVNSVLLRHPNINDLRSTLAMNDHDQLIQTSTNRKIQFFSFTFFTLRDFIQYNLFEQLDDKRAAKFFKDCGY